MKRLLTVLFCLVCMYGRTAAAAEPAGAVLSVADIMAETLKNNPAVRGVEAAIGAAEAAVKSARSDMLPEGEFSYGYTSFTEPPVMKIDGTELQAAHQRIYNWDVTVVQPLFSGFALTSKLDISKLEAAARKLEKEQTELELVRNVKSACYNLMLVKRLLTVGQDEVAALEAHRRNAELFYQQGLIRKNDLLQAQVALADSRQQLETARANVRKAEMMLNRLMNRPLALPVNLSDAAAAVETSAADSYDPEALGNQAIGERPLMQLLSNGIQQLGLTEKMVKSALYPTVALVGRYERSGDDLTASNNDYANADNASITVQLQWKFWRSGKTRADTDQVRQKMRALEASIEGHRRQILEEVHSSVLDCRVAGGNIDTAAAALEQAKENWRITDLQYREQTALASDVLDARTFLSRADANYYRAVYGYLDAVAGLDRAMGKMPAP
jgi:outer membrane protein TolC